MAESVLHNRFGDKVVTVAQLAQDCTDRFFESIASIEAKHSCEPEIEEIIRDYVVNKDESGMLDHARCVSRLKDLAKLRGEDGELHYFARFVESLSYGEKNIFEMLRECINIGSKSASLCLMRNMLEGLYPVDTKFIAENQSNLIQAFSSGLGCGTANAIV